MVLEDVHGFTLLLRQFYSIGVVAVGFSTLIVSLITLYFSNTLHPDYRFQAVSVVIHWILTCFIGIIFPIIPLAHLMNLAGVFLVISTANFAWCISRTWLLIKAMRTRILGLENHERRLEDQVANLEIRLDSKDKEVVKLLNEIDEKDEEIEELNALLDEAGDSEEPEDPEDDNEG